MEEWKTIKDFLNYEVSDFGQVRNTNGKVLKQMKNRSGRFVVDLGRQCRAKHVSRLVAQAFVLNPENKPEVDHINRDCSDNRASNLRWVTRSENIQNTRDKGTTSGERCIYKTPTSFLVQICRNNSIVYRKNFVSLEEAIQNRNHFLSTYNQTQTQNPDIVNQPLTLQ